MSAETASLPLFYRSPRVLQAAAHAGCGVKPMPDFGFAAEANSVPIGAEEFFEAQAHFPIVFSATEPATAIAVLGLEQNRNLFVDANKHWRRGGYVPAYIRRYPFVFITVGDNNYVLGIDEDSPAFSRTEGEALFDNDEPSAMTKRALEFCSAFQAQDTVARDFCAALKAHDLLTPHRADFRGADAKGLSLSGFTTIDEQRFAALPDEVILDWRKRNWLGLVYAHLLSQRRWNDLAALLTPVN
jgi:hypothetical protein